VSANGLRAVSASDDQTLKVWNLKPGALVASFTCDEPPRCCAFAGDGRTVADDASRRVHILSLELKRDI
jgi:WD40 repeat protein